MKKIIFVFMLLICTSTLFSAKNEIIVKKLGENSASFIVNSDESRTLLVLYPATEMLPTLEKIAKQELATESIDISNLKSIKNNAYIVFDGVQSSIPLTIKGLKSNSAYFLSIVKPADSKFKPVSIEFSTVAPEPKKQTKGIAFRQPTENSIELVFSNGDGESRLVVASKGKSDVEVPVDGNEYKASAKFGSAESKIGNSFVVYSGNKSECKVENLDAATVYNFQVFEFNGKGKSANYLASKEAGNPRNKMTAIPAPKMLPAKEVTESGCIIAWKGYETIEKYTIDIAYDENFTRFADTYENADVGNIEEIEVVELDPKENWYVRVKAYGEGTESRYSETLKIK